MNPRRRTKKKRKTSPENFLVNFCNPQKKLASQPKTPHWANLPKNPQPSRLSKRANISKAPWGNHPPPKLTSEVSALCPLNSALVLEYLVTVRRKAGWGWVNYWISWFHGLLAQNSFFFGFLEGEKVEGMRRPTRFIHDTWKKFLSFISPCLLHGIVDRPQAMREKLYMSFGCILIVPQRAKYYEWPDPCLETFLWLCTLHIYRRIFSIFCVCGFLINSDHKNHHKIQTIFWHPNVTRPPAKSNVSVNPILTSAVWGNIISYQVYLHPSKGMDYISLTWISLYCISISNIYMLYVE